MSAGLKVGTGRGMSGSAGSSTGRPPSSSGSEIGPGDGAGLTVQLPLTLTAGRHFCRDNSVSEIIFTAAVEPVTESLPAADTCKPISSGAVLVGSSGLTPSTRMYDVQLSSSV